MSFLALTIPATLLLAGTLLLLVLRAVRRGELDDMEGPAERQAFDDDACPERAAGAAPAAPAPSDREPADSRPADQSLRGLAGTRS